MFEAAKSSAACDIYFAPELVVGAAAVGYDFNAVEGERDVRSVRREQLLARLRRQRGVCEGQRQVACMEEG